MYSSLSESEMVMRLDVAEHQSFHERPFPQFEGRPARPAAVLLPLTLINNDWHMLYTRRTDIVEHHKGQVSFPGGATDPQDADAVETALREAEEEVGLRRTDVQVLGKLGQMLTVTNFLITPIVGIFPWPYTFTMQTVEVARIFVLPLRWLADPQNWQEFVRKETNRPVVTYFPNDGELVWGATARITVEFIRAMGWLIPDETDQRG